MNFNNKWRDYLTESKEQIEEMEAETELNMDGKVISNKTPSRFEKGGEVKHGKMGLGKIVEPDARGDFVIVDFGGQKRMVPYSELTIVGDKKDDKKDEKVLDEMCGGDHTPAVMMPALSLGGDEKDTRRVTPHDREGRMAKAQLYKITKYAMEMMENLHDDDELESWVQSKITKAASYMSAAKHYLEYEYKHPPHMDEIMPMMESTQKKVDEIFEEAIGSKKKSS